jgi:hypothetical protein
MPMARPIERRAFFAHISGVDRDALRGTLKPELTRRTNPLAALLDRTRSESDNRPLRKSLRRVDLNDDVVRVNADESSRTDRGKHESS